MISILSLSARGADGGSAYSILGLGDLRLAPGVRYAGMGNAGIALPGASYINSLSPATWSRINRIRIEAAFLYEGFSSSDGTTSRFLSTGTFNGALLAIPISTAHGIVFVGGFTPYSTTNYDIFTSGSQMGIDFTIQHVGRGGLTKGQVGFSYAPSQELSLGASFNYLFGTVNTTRTFTPISASYAGGKTLEKFTARGSGASIGAVYTGFAGINELSLGIVVSTRTTLTTERQLTYEFQSERDTTNEQQGTLGLPIGVGIGLAYQLGERYLFAADYFTQPWSSADLTGVRNEGIRNNHRISAGAERLPSRDTFASWLDKLSYRLGFYYDASYYSINGQPINQWTVTGGLTVPLSGETRLNVALEYGSRGKTENNLIRDKIVRLLLSVNFSELWFIQYDEE